jgi:hypothetical protein
MLMTTSLRKLALTTHVTFSVGWFGAVASFLVLAVAGVTHQNAETARAAYMAMRIVTWSVIVPFSLAALTSGVLQSLGTTWGLFRYYWIVAKLALTALATLILLVHTEPIGRVAGMAAARTLADGDLHPLRIQLIADAGAALVALVVATVLSVYKPWGLTAYGQRQSVVVDAPRAGRSSSAITAWTVLWAVALLAAVVLFIGVHLASGGFHHH